MKLFFDLLFDDIESLASLQKIVMLSASADMSNDVSNYKQLRNNIVFLNMVHIKSEVKSLISP